MVANLKLLKIFISVIAVCPSTLHKRKLVQLMNQYYIVIWMCIVLYFLIFRGSFLMLKTLNFQILNVACRICEFALTITLTSVITKDQSKTLKLVMRLEDIWKRLKCDSKLFIHFGKFFVIWLGIVVLKCTITLYLNNYSLSIFIITCIVYIRISWFWTTIVLTLFEFSNQWKMFNRKLKFVTKLTDVNELQATQTKIFHVIDDFNDIFGKIIFWTILTGTVLVINNICQLFGFHKTIGSNQHWMLTVDVFLVQMYVVAMVLLADRLALETEKTIEICHKKSQDVCIADRKQNLFIKIALQTHFKNMKIHACGFFDVDNSTLVFIICTVCTYVTVIFQTISS
ncbi:hypothetical protein ABEB36_013401 [Hypothenemus hampei]|uniref:Gustatory receptor n=1 Tax=Hypothenemus hampei TaxID=57062 RepID=A0ABD1E8T3_HYPHA